MFRYLYTALPALLSGCLLLACGQQGDQLDRVLDRGELRVITRNSPTTYYYDKTGPEGYEYALTRRLAEELGVRLKLETASNLPDLFRTLDLRKSDLAAAGLTLTSARQQAYDHSLPYDRLTPQVVYRAGDRRPRSLEDAAGMQLVVLAGSSHAEFLSRLRNGQMPGLVWQEIQGADSMELLELVDSGEAQLAVLDSNEFKVQQGLYPSLKVAFELEAEQDMVWYLPPGEDATRLREHIDEFLLGLQNSGELAKLREEYFGHVANATRIGSHTFARNLRNDLPNYRDLIRQVAAEYQMDWHLLAAIAYQESHWNPKATSPTGVRGMMMLTLPTAREMGVKNRLDPLESLRGGARYLKNIKRRLPDDIEDPDRTWFALAAYNIGRGHLEDARVLTERQGGDPHLWSDVMQRLPQLQKSKYFQTVKRGYARGLEAVTYVQNIRHYYAILQWHDIPELQPSPPLQPAEYLPEQLRGTSLSAI